MTSGNSIGLTLDTGALLALERGDSRVRALLARALQHNVELAIPAGVLAQAWRGGPRQARVARLIADPQVQVAILDEVTAQAVGLLCGRSGHSDVVDVHVALHARMHQHRVTTSDPQDLLTIDGTLDVIVV